MQRRLSSYLAAAALFGLLIDAAALRAADPPAVKQPSEYSDEQIRFFESRIRPLLAERCWKCHSDAKQQGNLRLDSRAAILAGGDLGSAATPGDPAASRIVEVVGYAGDVKMPPSGRLPDGEIAALGQWVRDGLAWPETETTPGTDGESQSVKQQPRPTPWSFAPIADPPLPAVGKQNWCQSPIDQFVLARLEAAGINPAPPADRRTLIRRAKFDLLGLPPTPEEIDAFLANSAPDAFAQLVDRLLASPEYGQRWGRHWLDVARYADSNGQDENLAYVNAFRYRDYVVDAFNSDLPYNQFVREQIAGDLIPQNADEQQRFARLIATGFLTLGPKMLAEDDPVKMEMDIVDEQVDTVGGAFLGLTLGCARCHDHKFDPLTMADYYALAGIFKSTKTMDNFKVVAQWHERPLATSAEVAALAEHRTRVDAKKAELAEIVKRANAGLVQKARGRIADYLVAATELLSAPMLESLLQTDANAQQPTTPPGAVFIEAEQFARGNVLVDTTGYGAGIGIILNRGELPNYTEYDVELPAAGWYQIEIRYAAAEPRSVQLIIGGKLRKADAAGNVTGSWNPDGQRWTPEGVFQLPAGKNVVRVERSAGPIPHLDRLALIPLATDGTRPEQLPLSAEELARERGLNPQFLSQWMNHLRDSNADSESIWQLWFAFQQHGDLKSLQRPGVAGDVAARVLNAAAPGTAAELAARYQSVIETVADKSADKPSETLADPADEALRQLLVGTKSPLRIFEKPESSYSPQDRDAVASIGREIAELDKTAPPAPPQAMAVEEGTPSDLRIHLRGSHLALGEVAPRGFPRMFGVASPAMPSDASGRLEFADWLICQQNPLASRVLVNRLWRWHFGAGIVRSTDNFGNLGERPSHPDLLDWLASRFVESGWSVKSIHRLIMLSSTYQMSTFNNAAAVERDPDNRLLWRMNRRRLEAEAVRDAILFVGAGLDTSLGGNLLHSKAREYVTSTASVDATNYATNRRSLYLPVVRSALYEAFQAFDFAEPTVIKGDRDSTTISSQALFMMNSDLMYEQSEALAMRLLSTQPDHPQARIHDLYLIALGRPATETEVARAIRFVDQYAASPQLKTDSQRSPRAWQALCRVVLSSNEFLYVE